MQIPTRLLDLFNTAPLDTNPYTFAIQWLVKLERPLTPIYLRPALILVAVVHAAIGLCCAALIMIPYFQGAEVKARHIWILKRQYLGNHQRHYYILNNVMVIGISQLVTSILYELFISLQLNSLSSVLSIKIHRFSWIEILKLFSHCGIFIQAFTLLFISASNPSASAFKKYLMPPLAFNTMLIGFPVITAISSLFLTAQKSNAVTKQDDSVKILIEMLTNAAGQWQLGQMNLKDEQNDSLQHSYEVFLKDSTTKLDSRLHIGLFWSFMGLPSIISYLGGVAALLNTVYQPVAESPSLNTKTGTFRQSKELQHEPTQASNEFRIEHCDGKSVRLKRSLKFLWYHYFFMSLALCLDVGTGLGFYLNKKNLTSTQSAGIYFIINIFGSLLVLTGMAILLARVIIEVKESKPSTAGHNGALREKSFNVSTKRELGPDDLLS